MTSLHDKDGRRPDLELILRSLHALLDVMIVNPLCPTHLIASSKESLASVRGGERKKTKVLHLNMKASSLHLSSSQLVD